MLTFFQIFNDAVTIIIMNVTSSSSIWNIMLVRYEMPVCFHCKLCVGNLIQNTKFVSNVSLMRCGLEMLNYMPILMVIKARS